MLRRPHKVYLLRLLLELCSPPGSGSPNNMSHFAVLGHLHDLVRALRRRGLNLSPALEGLYSIAHLAMSQLRPFILLFIRCTAVAFPLTSLTASAICVCGYLLEVKLIGENTGTTQSSQLYFKLIGYRGDPRIGCKIAAATKIPCWRARLHSTP